MTRIHYKLTDPTDESVLDYIEITGKNLKRFSVMIESIDGKYGLEPIEEKEYHEKTCEDVLKKSREGKN